MVNIFRKQQNNLNFGRRKTWRKSTITFNYWIVDGNIELPYSTQIIDEYNE